MSPKCGPQTTTDRKRKPRVFQIHPNHRLPKKECEGQKLASASSFPSYLSSGLGPKLSILIPVSDTSYALVLGLLFAPPLPCTLIAVHCNSFHPLSWADFHLMELFLGSVSNSGDSPGTQSRTRNYHLGQR